MDYGENNVMTKQDITEYTMAQIISDYKSIFVYLQDCLNNKIDYPSIMGVMPYICMLVSEGYAFLQREQLICGDIIAKDDLDIIKNCRANGIKLYEGFKTSTFNSINMFNRDEYIKFYKNSFPKEKIILLHSVMNYFLCFTNELPIGNYHLYSKRVTGIEIGTYKSDITEDIYNFTYILSNFIAQILNSMTNKKYFPYLSKKKIEIDFKYLELNMAFKYKYFCIKNSPPVLIAFLDVLCVINFYNEVFTKINEDEILDIKIKYIILFYSVLSLKDII